VQSFVKKFKDDFERHIAEHRCPFGEGAWGVSQDSRDAVIGGMRA
jgi:NADH-quinone oxidoreductase subunit F